MTEEEKYLDSLIEEIGEVKFQALSDVYPSVIEDYLPKDNKWMPSGNGNFRYICKECGLQQDTRSKFRMRKLICSNCLPKERKSQKKDKYTSKPKMKQRTDQVKLMLEMGINKSEIARQTKCSRMSIWRLEQKLKKEEDE